MKDKKISEIGADIKQIEIKRKKFVSDYAREVLSELTIEEYAIGKGTKDNFCYRLEHEQIGMGDIRGTFAGSTRYGVWYSKKAGEYAFSKKYGDSVESAFISVKKELVNLIEAGERDDFVMIRGNKIANNVKYKILAMYYPYKYLTIYSPRHLSYFCNQAGIPAIQGDDELVMQRKLIQWKESKEQVKSLSYLEYVAFLYHQFGHPPKVDAENQSKSRLKELKKKLHDFDGNHSKKTLTEIERIERSRLVAAVVKERAAGICQLCNKPAPFYNKKGEPYLECHHIIWIANGGPDEVYNAVALCPNCHRKMHSLNEPLDIQYLKMAATGIFLQED